MTKNIVLYIITNHKFLTETLKFHFGGGKSYGKEKDSYGKMRYLSVLRVRRMVRRLRLHRKYGYGRDRKALLLKIQVLSLLPRRGRIQNSKETKLA